MNTAVNAKDWLTQMLADMPSSVVGKAANRNCAAGEILLHVDDQADSVFFLLSGRVAGINEQNGGLHFRYATFRAPMVFGEFEAFSDSAVYRCTLICEAACKVLILPRDTYIAWVRQDAAVLYARVRALAEQLMTQNKRERELLFLSGQERLAAFFATNCHQSKLMKDEYTLRFTLQQMADGIGCSVRTVQRGLDSLTEAGLIRRQKRCILVRAYALDRLIPWKNNTDANGGGL